MNQSTESFSNDTSQEPTVVESPSLVIDVVATEDAANEAVVEAFRSFGVTLRRHSNPVTWFTNLSRISEIEEAPELVVLAGDARQMLMEDWIKRVDNIYHHAEVVVAIANPSIHLVATLLKQGIRAFVDLPSASDRIVEEVSWLVHETSARRDKIRSAHASRLNMAKLTRAEIEVLQLMLEGQANKQIAQNLGIGLRTVELRRSKIMRKMDSKTVSQLMRYVYESAVDVSRM